MAEASDPFSAVAARYDATFSDLPAVKTIRARMYDLLTHYVRPGGKIFEIGCGTGDDPVWLGVHGYAVLATDPSAAMLDIARAKTPPELSSLVTFQELSADRLDRACPGPFNAIFSNFGALNCAQDLRSVFCQCKSLLAPSGVLVLCLMNPYQYVFDIAKKMPLHTILNQILDEWGRIDILNNHANVKPRASILDMDEWDWQRTLDVNLGGPFHTIQQVGRAMRQQGGGAIVNISSIAGRAHGLKDRAAYVASKTGLIGLTREVARELAAYNIRVNAVCPGVIETEMTAALRHDETMLRRWLEVIPQGRLGRTEDVVGVVLFLCSQAAGYVTGQAINVDGGKVMC